MKYFWRAYHYWSAGTSFTHNICRFLSFPDMLVENNVVGDIVVMEHVSLLYIMSWFSLQCFNEDGKRKQSCDELLTSIVPCLKLVFVLCSKVPTYLKRFHGCYLLCIHYLLKTRNFQSNHLLATLYLRVNGNHILQSNTWNSTKLSVAFSTKLQFFDFKNPMSTPQPQTASQISFSENTASKVLASSDDNDWNLLLFERTSLLLFL